MGIGGGSKDNRSEHNRGFPANVGLIVTAREPSGLDKKNNKRNDMTSKKIRSDNRIVARLFITITITARRILMTTKITIADKTIMTNDNSINTGNSKKNN